MYLIYSEENMLLPRDLLELWKTIFLSPLQLFQKMFIFEGWDDIVDKYNNTCHKTIKMKPINVTSHSYAKDNKNSNEKDPKFKVGDCVRT